MAKMNTRGASPSRLEPPGSCSHNAKTQGIPEKNNATAKLILCNEIPYSNRDRRNRPSSLAERNSAHVCFFRRLNAGILFSYSRRSCSLQARTGDAAPRFRSERAQKETHLIPKLNRMPDGRLRCQGHYAEFTRGERRSRARRPPGSRRAPSA